MDRDRVQWITRPATLDRFSLTVTLADTPTGPIATLWAAGQCNRKRGNLWVYDETCPAEGGRYSLVDLVTHLTLVAVQDRPTSNKALTQGLVGSAWEQPELPF